MAATRGKQRAMELKEKPRNRACDWEDDIYRFLESGTLQFNNLSTLLQEFAVQNPNRRRGDPEMLKFMDGLYGIVKRRLLHLQEQNRDGTAEEEEDDVPVDPQYRHFLNHLRVDGKSYVLDIVEEGVFVKYDSEQSPPWTPTVKHLDPGMHAPKNNTGKRRGRKPKLPADKNPDINGNRVASEAQKHAPNYTGKRRGRKPKHAVPKTVNGKGLPAVKTVCQSMDHRTKVNHTDTPSGIAKRVKVEIEDSDCDDDPPDITKPVPEPVLNVEHRRHSNEAKARENAGFREKLMEVLKMPYCEEEYERLLQIISDRKPVQHHRDLRGGIKIYEEDFPGKSFLDHHTDLAKKIDSIRDDHPRVLNLLRGFFYWLIHLSHEGAFQPWRDPSCLDVLPRELERITAFDFL